MKHQQRVYLTHPKMPALVDGILTMPRPSSVGGGLIGLFLLTWVSLWAQVAQAGTIFNQPGPFTGDPIPISKFPDSSALDLTSSDFTISACIYQTRRNDGASSAILTKRGSENGWGLLLEGKSGAVGDTGIVKFRSSHDNVNELVASSQVLSLNTKYHVAVVYQGGVAQIFINGASDGTNSIRPPKAPDGDKPLRVGGDYDYTTKQDRYRWRGTLSNLQIDDTAFSLAQIQTLSNNCGGGCTDPNDPKCCTGPECDELEPCDNNNPFDPTCTPDPEKIKPTYDSTTGQLYIPQLNFKNSTQVCTDVYLQYKSSSLFSLKKGTCNK
jgi:hypothetical protein